MSSTRVEGPAAHLFQQRAGEAEAGARAGAGDAQAHPGGVQVGAVVDVPQPIAGGDPVGHEILAVAVAADGGKSGGEGAVHLQDVIRREKVVRVEHQIGVEAVPAVIGADVLQQRLQGVALAYMAGVPAPVHHRPVLPGQTGGAVGAVVRQDEGRDQRRRIGLGPDAVKQIGQHRLLVPGGDEHGIAPAGRGRRFVPGGGAFFRQDRQEQIDGLIGVGEAHQSSQHCQDDPDEIHGRHVFCSPFSAFVLAVDDKDRQ